MVGKLNSPEAERAASMHQQMVFEFFENLSKMLGASLNTAIKIFKGGRNRPIYGQDRASASDNLSPADLHVLKQSLNRSPSPQAVATNSPNFRIEIDGHTVFQLERNGQVSVNHFSLGKFALATENIESSPEPKNIDSDRDGLTDLQETYLATDPKNIDTDRDGRTDFQEFVTDDTNPLSIDTDSDGLIDRDEFDQTTNRSDCDSDSDGQPDGGDERPLSSFEEELIRQPPLEVEIPPAIRVARDDLNLVDAKNNRVKDLLSDLITQISARASQFSKNTQKWLAARPELSRQQDAAQTFLSLFNANFEQTGLTNYQANQYRVELQGLNTYRVIDSAGDLKLEFEKTARGIKIERSSLSERDYLTLRKARQSIKSFGAGQILKTASRPSQPKIFRQQELSL